MLQAAEAAIYYPSFDTLRLPPNERLSRFDLRIRPGMVIGFCRVPIGWRIEIDNDPSWTSRISGIAIVGAADLDQKDFREKFFSILQAPADVRRSSGLPKHVSVTGYLWLANGDKTRRVTIRKAELVPGRLTRICE